jgi:hypothetical protein
VLRCSPLTVAPESSSAAGRIRVDRADAGRVRLDHRACVVAEGGTPGDRALGDDHVHCRRVDTDHRQLLAMERRHAELRDDARDPDGRRLSISILSQTFRRYAQAAGVTERKRVTPHTLRHMFAPELLHAGANLRQIQELLGHKHLDSTQRYTRVNAHELRGAVKRLQFPTSTDRDRSRRAAAPA